VSECWSLTLTQLQALCDLPTRCYCSLVHMYSQSSMMAHPYGTNCTCRNYCHSQF